MSKVPHINQAKGPANQYQPKGQYPARVYAKPNYLRRWAEEAADCSTECGMGKETPGSEQPRTSKHRHRQNHNQDWQNRHSQRDLEQQQLGGGAPASSSRSSPSRLVEEPLQQVRALRHAAIISGTVVIGIPAYGYDPAYNTYAYDEPIYGYNDLDPAQVIANVQTELQRLGYYRYAVDGWMGPMTRAAIANYQRDNGLAITSAIDGPTLQSLGLD